MKAPAHHRLPPIADLPPMATPVHVVGDVHLCPEEPEVVQRFLAYLDSVAARGGTLVLLGDVFDYWVGRPQARDAFSQPILAKLKAVAEAGVEIAFQPGNRDYPFDGSEEMPITVWPDVVRTLWGDRTVLLTHGDLLCTSDHGYLKYRNATRTANGKQRLWSRLIPYSVASYLARGLRNVSMRETKRKSPSMMGIDYAVARSWLETADADVLVAGHVHTGVHHYLPEDPDASSRRDVFVLLDWEHGGGVVEFDGSSIRLVRPEGA